MNKLMNTLTSGYPEDSINHKSHPDHDKPGFVVRATGRGYYGLAMREEGDQFRIAFARHFADVDDPKLNGLGWMTRVENASKAQKRQADIDARNEARGVGVRPPPEDPAERQRRMKAGDKMAEEAIEEDKDKAEADMI